MTALARLDRQHLRQHVALLLLVLAMPLEAQSWRDALPLQFAQPSADVRRQLERDWKRLAPRGAEWAYCVTAWTIDRTPDGDSVYIATRAVLMASSGKGTSVTGFDCRGEGGEYLPVIHSHLTEDCSPSRADIEAIAGRGIWGLVQCGPRQFAGYAGRMYLLALRGARPPSR